MTGGDVSAEDDEGLVTGWTQSRTSCSHHPQTCLISSSHQSTCSPVISTAVLPVHCTV
jgi:hypothetical protein